jgi:hypothetical protein
MSIGTQPAPVVQAASCPSCETELQGNFCHQCGEKRPHRHELSFKHFALHGLHELTHLDSKIFSTVRYLFSRPGYLTQEFVAGRKSLYMRPLSLFLVACAMLFLSDSYFPRSAYDVNWITHQDKTGKIDHAWTKLAAKKKLPKEILMERVQDRIHKISTTMQFANVIVLAVMLALLYHRRYFVEHLVFAFHFLSLTFIASALLRPLTSRLEVYAWASYAVSGVVTAAFLVYLFLALRRVYRQGPGITIVKSLLIYVVTWIVLIVTQIATLVASVVAAAKS